MTDNSLIDNKQENTPFDINYYLSKKAQKKIGKKKSKKLLDTNDSQRRALWQSMHSIKAILLFSATEFSHGTSMRIDLSTQNKKEKETCVVSAIV